MGHRLDVRPLVPTVLFTASPILHWISFGPTIPEGTYFLISRLGRTAVDEDPSNVIYSFARALSFELVDWTFAYPLAFLIVGLIAHSLFNAAIFVLARSSIRSRHTSEGAAQLSIVAVAVTLLIFPLGVLTRLAGAGTTLIPHDAYYTFSIRTLFWVWMAIVYTLLIRRRTKLALWLAALGPLLHPNAGLLAFGLMTVGVGFAAWQTRDRSLVWHWFAAVVAAALPVISKVVFSDASELMAFDVSYADWYSSVIKDEADDFSFLFQLIYRTKAVAAITALVCGSLVIYSRVFADFRKSVSFWAAAIVVASFYIGVVVEYVFAVLMPTPVIHLLVALTPGYRLLSFAFFPTVALGTELLVAGIDAPWRPRASPAVPDIGRRGAVAVAAVAAVAITWTGLLVIGVARGRASGSLLYAKWALDAGRVEGIDGYLEGLWKAGQPSYYAPTFFRLQGTVVTYPHERNPVRIWALDKRQPRVDADLEATARITTKGFTDLTKAVRAQLPKGAGLIVPPYLRYFRDALVDYRIFFQEHHDGNLMLGSPAFLGFWQSRMLAVLGRSYEHLPSQASNLSYTVMRNHYLGLNTQDVDRLAVRFPAYRYLVAEHEHRLGFAPVIRTESFVVYDLRTRTDSAAGNARQLVGLEPALQSTR